MSGDQRFSQRRILGVLLFVFCMGLGACEKKNQSPAMKMSEAIGIRLEWSGPPFEVALVTSDSVDPSSFHNAFAGHFVRMAKACPTLLSNLPAQLNGEVAADKVIYKADTKPYSKCLVDAGVADKFLGQGKTFSFNADVRTPQ
jgi:hypothetical protein